MAFRIISLNNLPKHIKPGTSKPCRYTNSQKLAIWRKASRIVGSDSNLWRMDVMGGVMYWPHYGKRDSQFGWEIDHITPKVAGGGNELENLQPLYWRNNAQKGSKLHF
jgi:hypothetical protein